MTFRDTVLKNQTRPRRTFQKNHRRGIFFAGVMGYIGEFKLLSGAVVKKSKLLNELKSELTICLLETESLPPLFSLSIYTY